jgi:hypothetical protein
VDPALFDDNRIDNREESMSDTNIVVATFVTHEEAAGAIGELQRAGFDMKKLSIVARNTHAEEHVVGYYNAGDRIRHWGERGAFWGGVWGLLFGAAFFAFPGLGPVAVAGPLVAWIVAALEGAVVVGGAGAIGAALVGVGIPKDSVLEYEIAIRTDQFLLLFNGTPLEAAAASEIIAATHPVSLQTHALREEAEYERELALAKS